MKQEAKNGIILISFSLITLTLGPSCQLVVEVDESRIPASEQNTEVDADVADNPDGARSEPDPTANPKDGSTRDVFVPAGGDAAPFDAGLNQSDATATDAQSSRPDAALSDECKTAEDCPAIDGPCQSAKCSAGRCTTRNEADGTSCVVDKCIIGQECSAGVCVGGRERDCSEFDSACTTGVCDSASGACLEQQQADGTDCSDGLECTRPDKCRAGVCLGRDRCRDKDDYCSATLNRCVERDDD